MSRGEAPHRPSGLFAEQMLSRETWRLIRLGASALLIATGAIHLDLYLTGYRTIPAIGWLFLLQVIGDGALAVMLIAIPRRIVAAAGAGLFLSTLVGYLLALRTSLFGFREIRTTAGIAAAAIEIVGFGALASLALSPYGSGSRTASKRSEGRALARRRVAIVVGRWIAGVLTVQAALSLALLLPNAGATSTNSRSSVAIVKVAQVHGVSVLTNARGYTLYWFAPDSSTRSHCYGTCAAYWPPVTGTPTSTDVAGSFTTVRRTNGARQVTYNGHPLYTYVGDSAPGQASGDHIRLNGGWWYEMKAT